MNDSVSQELKKQVERSVRPIRVGFLRKRRMREELLSHLSGIFEEEYEKQGDERSALAEAVRRFGDPAEIRNELQHSVLLQDRYAFLVERFQLQPGESVFHFFGKHLLIVCLQLCAMSLLMVPLLLFKGQWTEIGTMLRIMGVISLVTPFLGMAFLWLSDRIGRSLHGEPAERSRLQAITSCLAALLLFPLLILTTHWGLGIAMPSGAALGVAIAFAPVAPLGLILLSRQVADRIHHEREWASLDLDA